MSNLAQSNKGIFLATFFAGAAALFYQIVWTRVIERFVGVALPTVALISVVFLGGLALGGAIASLNSEKFKQPLKTFAFSQAILAGTGLFFILFQSQLYALIANISTTDPALLGLFEAIRLIFISLLLMVPTILFGLVFPLLIKAISKKYSIDSAPLYLLGANSLGAVVGVLSCGLLALPRWGIDRSVALAIVFNLLSALIALYLSSARQEGDHFAIKPVEVSEPPAWLSAPNPSGFAMGERAYLFWVFAAGLFSMLFELLWMRLLIFFTGSSIYAFSLILACQIIGWTSGAYLVAFYARHALLKYENQYIALERLFTLICYLLTAAVLWTLFCLCALDWLPFISSMLQNAFFHFSANQPALAFMTGRFWLALVFVTPSALALGTIFPAVLHAYALKEDRKDEDFGFLYVSNLLGAIAGCIMGGLVLHYLLSQYTNTPLMHSLVLTCFLFFVFVLVFSNYIHFPRRRLVSTTLVGGIVLLVILKPSITLNSSLIGLGFHNEDPQAQTFLDDLRHAPNERLEECIAYREGTNAIVSVIKNSATNTLSLKTDGRMEAALPDDLQWPSPTSDLPTHNLLAEIPLLLCPLDPQDVLLIGYGSGATADTFLDYPGLKRLTALDLAGDLFSFSRYFAQNFLHTKESAKDTRLNLVKGDGRNYLSLLKRRYDIIASQPGEPYLNGMGDLYTKEFWQLGRSRLRNYGLFCQWIQLYGLDRDAVLTLCRTFQNVFPHTLVFRASGAAEIILVGFKLPAVTESEAVDLSKMARSPKAMKGDVSVAVPDISINWNNFVQRFHHCDVKRRLARISVRDPLDVMTMLRFGQSDLAELLEGKNAPQETNPGSTFQDSAEKNFNIDDQPIVEFQLSQFAPQKTALNDLIHLFSAVPTRLDTFFIDIGSTKRDTADLYVELAMKYAELGQSEPEHKLREEFLTTCAMLARRAYRLNSTDGGLPGRGYVLTTFQSPIPKSLDLLMYGFEPKTSKNVEDCLIIGRFFELRNLPERAGQCFARASELAPKSERALRFLLNWQLKHQRFKEAIATSNRAYALDRTSDWALAGRGEAELHEGQASSAIDDFRKALALNPELFQARFLLGKALCSSGIEKTGLEEIYWASLVKPESPEPNLYVTAYYVFTGQWQAAKDNLIVLRRKLPQDPRVDKLAQNIEEQKTIDKSDLPN